MKWNRTDPGPDPKKLAAWADGELNRADAERVEAWLARHPDTDEAGRLVRLYRDHPPEEPSERAWEAALTNLAHRAMGPASPDGTPVRRQSPPGWRPRLLLALAATAALVAGVLLARSWWIERTNGPYGSDITNVLPPSPATLPRSPDDSDEPFPVATLGEVEIISIRAEDADRLLMGQPLLGTFEVAAPEDVEIVQMEPHSEDGQMPLFRRGQEVPMILAAVDRQTP
jgi:hypothetical protein